MKIAIVHDVFIDFGGAERVLLALLTMYPEADVYIPLLTKTHESTVRKSTRGNIVSSWFNQIPYIFSVPSLTKLFMYMYWESLDLHRYDVVISSSHSFSSKSVVTRPSTLHVSYVHTPPRYLYNEFNETQIIKAPVIRTVLSPLMKRLRHRDFIGAQRPDVLIANSQTVRARIKKYYFRDSEVIYPPVTLPKKLYKRNPRYFLCVSRLVKQKGIDLAIRSCNQLKEKLVIVGSGSEESHLRSIAGPTIEFLGYVKDERMPAIYAGAKALLYPSLEEDFGMVPVEAMAHGVPVIGYNSAGTAETVVDGKTGFLFNTWSVAGLTDAMYRQRKNTLRLEDMYRQANKFSYQKFVSSFTHMLSEHIAGHKNKTGLIHPYRT